MSLSAIYTSCIKKRTVPVDYVCKEIVVLQPVVWVHTFVVDGEGTSSDTSLVFCCWMSSKLSREHIEDLLTDPSTFSEGGECKIVGVNFSEACKDE